MILRVGLGLSGVAHESSGAVELRSLMHGQASGDMVLNGACIVAINFCSLLLVIDLCY